MADVSKVELNERVKKHVSEGIQYLYGNTEAADFVDASNSISDILLKAISDNEALAFDINILKVSDEYTFKHSVDVATIAMMLARKARMSPHEVHVIGVCELLHDIGKSKIPNEILNKPGKLTVDEFDLIKHHPVLGHDIIKEKIMGTVILYPVGSIVLLSNGEQAKVVSNNPSFPLRPKVVGLRTGKIYDLAEDLACANIVID